MYRKPFETKPFFRFGLSQFCRNFQRSHQYLNTINTLCRLSLRFPVMGLKKQFETLLHNVQNVKKISTKFECAWKGNIFIFETFTKFGKLHVSPAE